MLMTEFAQRNSFFCCTCTFENISNFLLNNDKNWIYADFIKKNRVIIEPQWQHHGTGLLLVMRSRVFDDVVVSYWKTPKSHHSTKKSQASSHTFQCENLLAVSLTHSREFASKWIIHFHYNCTIRYFAIISLFRVWGVLNFGFLVVGSEIHVHVQICC